MADSFSPPPLMQAVSVAQQIYDYLRLAIMDGALKPRERLTEESLAKTLSVSRTPVREALRRLEVEGLIEYVPNKQVVVSDFTSEEIAEVYDLRMLLEGYAARCAAPRITEPQLSELQELCARFDAARAAMDDAQDTTHQMVDLNERFHEIITLASGRTRLPRILKFAIAVPLVYRSYRFVDLHRKEAGVLHWRIVEALRDRDGAKAEELMHEHLQGAKDFILEYLSSREEG